MVKRAEESALAGICGLFCGDCPYYLARRIGDEKTLEQLSASKGLTPDETACEGCLSDKVGGTCIKCRHGFRDCAAEHGVTWCFECKEFPCLRLTTFLHAHIMDGVSHHERIVQDSRIMRKIGIDAWIKMRREETTCSCGRPLYWYQKSCPECGRERKL